MSESSANSIPDQYLDKRGVELINFIEKFHALTGLAPERAAMMEFLTQNGYNFQGLDKLICSDLFQRSLQVRGITLAPLPSGHLTPRQIATVSVMTNMSDRRSDEKKLRDLGVSKAEWESWRFDNDFNAYLEGRVEKMLGHSVSDAHMGLIRAAKSGNVPAIKLLYEVTGRYNPDRDNVLNVQLLMAKIIEIIQKHVRDPETLQGLGLDLTQLSIESSMSGERRGIH